MRERPLIGLDVDGVISDIGQTIVSIYNYKSICVSSPPFIKNDTYSVEDIVDYDFSTLIGEECFMSIVSTMENSKACMRLPLYAGAQAMVSELKEIGDVIFITKPFLIYKDWYVERNFWMKKNFGVDPKDIIYTSKKHLIDVDILIDDCVDILKDWIIYTKKPAIKVIRPWNADFNNNRVSSVFVQNIPETVNKLLNDK